MYLISNQDITHMIRFLDVMISHAPTATLTERNAVRMARELRHKLVTKKPVTPTDGQTGK